MITYIALALAILALVLLVWHALTPTPPAHRLTIGDAAGIAAAAGGT